MEQNQIEQVKVQGTGKVARVFMAIFGVLMLFIGTMTGIAAVSELSKEETEGEAQLFFDPYTETAAKQYITFEMISYPFASFELNDSQGLYFVFDEEMYCYIVCMDNDRLETEFKEIYDYTFSDSSEVPKAGELEGYSRLIEDDLKAIAIEEFNLLWESEIVNEKNFEDYFGSYYLDSTYTPTDGESPTSDLIAVVFLVLMGIYMLYYAVKGYKKAQQRVLETQGLKDKADSLMNSDGTEAGLEGQTDLGSATVDVIQAQGTISGAGELPVPRNIFLSVLATIVGAVAGGILWILFYKLGRIAAISGYLAVIGAIWGWCKFGRREMKPISAVWCVLVGVAMIVFANYISYAWEIADAMNASNPGRAEFMKVFTGMPSLMTELDLWGSFWADLGMGIVFSVIAGLSSLFGKKKK